MAKKKEAKKKRQVGRPTDYTLELATRICEEFATSTESYEEMCERNPDFPSRKNMRIWRYKHEAFRIMYDTARKDQADLYIDEIRERARDRSRDILNGVQGPKGNTAAVARDKLIIDTDKWVACKVLPKTYGDKPAAEEESPFTDSERAELHAIISNLVAKHEREY